MVDSRKIVTFTQSTDSCVLASYAIAGNYYTDIKIRTFFDGYCNHYSITKPFDFHKYLFGPVKITAKRISELAYDSHFHEECKNSGVSGLEFIKELQDRSDHEPFPQSRRSFALSYHSEEMLRLSFSGKHANLKHTDSLLIAAFNKGRHLSSDLTEIRDGLQ